jgi:hypothetical protein
VNQLDIRVASQFAKHSGGLGRFVAEAVEFAEQGCALNFCHAFSGLNFCQL